MALTARHKGITLAITGGAFWGGSGVAGQYLLQDCGFGTAWLVASRMVAAGIILLLIDACQHHGDIFSVWRERRNARELLIFALPGMLAVQYSYFACIEYGNAAAATVLQYLMPAFMVLYTTVSTRRLPSGVQAGCVALAILGTFLLVTHGNLGTLALPALALFWGVISGITGAIYTMAPKRLIRTYRATLITGWGMLIGGLCLVPWGQPWQATGTWTALSIATFLYIIIFGTVLAFWFYLGSTKYIQPAETGVLASMEPLTAIVLSVLLLGASFGLAEILGAVCILATVAILARS